MTEDFENSGWKEKKLWAPSHAENSRAAPSRSNGIAEGLHPGPGPFMEGSASSGGPGALREKGSGKGPRSRLRAEGASAELPSSDRQVSQPLEAEVSGGGGSEPSRPPKTQKAVKPPKSEEALDPDSSDEESGSDGPPPEYAVLDMTVPRTALVINVSHVLKRLNGCCSLNQLTKTITSFKEKTGVSLEAFLRANPMTFKLEGRIVYLVDRDGEKWKPPPKVEASEKGGGKAGKGKGEARGAGGAKGEDSQSKGSGKGSKGKDGGKKNEGKASTGGRGKGSKKGKGKPAEAERYYDDSDAYDSWHWSSDGQWDSHGWDEWHSDSWKASSWKSSW